MYAVEVQKTVSQATDGLNCVVLLGSFCSLGKTADHLRYAVINADTKLSTVNNVSRVTALPVLKRNRLSNHPLLHPLLSEDLASFRQHPSSHPIRIPISSYASCTNWCLHQGGRGQPERITGDGADPARFAVRCAASNAGTLGARARPAVPPKPSRQAAQ